MRDLSRRGILPKGLAFAIDDLVLVQNWAERNDTRFTMRLDHGSADEEFEEVIVLHTDTCQYSTLIMWRNADSVFVQPLIGRRLAYASVSHALESLPVKETIVLTDIMATEWPVDQQRGERRRPDESPNRRSAGSADRRIGGMMKKGFGPSKPLEVCAQMRPRQA
jgi:hypothetical protein